MATIDEILYENQRIECYTLRYYSQNEGPLRYAKLIAKSYGPLVPAFEQVVENMKKNAKIASKALNRYAERIRKAVDLDDINNEEESLEFSYYRDMMTEKKAVKL